MLQGISRVQDTHSCTNEEISLQDGKADDPAVYEDLTDIF